MRPLSYPCCSRGRYALQSPEAGQRRIGIECNISGRDLGGFVSEVRRAVDAFARVIDKLGWTVLAVIGLSLTVSSLIGAVDVGRRFSTRARRSSLAIVRETAGNVVIGGYPYYGDYGYYGYPYFGYGSFWTGYGSYGYGYPGYYDPYSWWAGLGPLYGWGMYALPMSAYSSLWSDYYAGASPSWEQNPTMLRPPVR